MGVVSDPDGLGKQWRDLGWAAFEATPEEKRGPVFENLSLLIGLSQDARNSIRLTGYHPEEQRARLFWQQGYPLQLSALGRWDEVVAVYQSNIERIVGMKVEPQPQWHASLAASLRHAGKPEEAVKQDRLVEKFSLGRDGMLIANNYAIAQDYPRAIAWWKRALILADPATETFSELLKLNQTLLLQEGRWLEAGALAEARARSFLSDDVSGSYSMLAEGRGVRLNSDLGRALGHLGDDRARSIAALGNCHRLYPYDAGLADDFFPAVRKAGLIQEHDAWFKESWERIMAVVKRYPEAHNSANSAGWLASRALRNLGEAEALLETALALNPDQPAYLDTMAEIRFAKGDRAGAMDWSARAINFAPSLEIFRRQYEHYRTAPLPKP
ncbi:MAG: hypothetical protein EOP85_01510 [Verrucomicrobiaceae bacterium]|nr:MAG: hypothetical protein EOP85_01510 [Verrucomicrobiaceae bacterium]